MSSLKEQTIFGFIWKFLQNAGTQVIGFIISIVLARILMPSDYGMVAMINVFTSIANVFITTGFSSSVIQKKDLSEVDKNTLFVSGLIIALLLYSILFFSAPAISSFYHEPNLVALLRVQSISLIICSLYSVHGSLLTRNMLFKKNFMIGLSGVCVQGVVGIVLAKMGLGPWALVFSYLCNVSVCGIVTWIIVKWMPRLQFSSSSFKSVFSFSFKILCIGLFNSIFQNIQSLIIGRQYSSSDLAYYNRGFQFPSLIMQQVDGSMNAVLFSSLSKYQDNWDNGLRVLRHSMRCSMFICMPLMIGMIAVAEPMVLVLLTDKWLSCVPYVRLVAIICLFWPLSARTNALNALGKSGVSLALNISSHSLQLLLIIFTYKISVEAMVSSTILSSTIFLIIGAFVYRKYLNYTIRDQVMDILPTFIVSIVMGVLVYLISYIEMPAIIMLILQVIVGVVVYILLSSIFKLKSYIYLSSTAKQYVEKALKK